MRTLALALSLFLPGLTQAEPSPPEAPKPSPPVVTQHITTIRDQKIAYTATAGFLKLTTYEGKDRANIFYVAYTKDEVADKGTRPILFAFNGGPGSSSVWLHMGALGPRRIKMGTEGEPIGPPYQVVANEDSWLDLADLVFIDPVSTGYSRAVEGQDAHQFHGLEEDIDAVGEFIRLYTTKNGRWASPKFLAGESYGTTRAAGLAQHLQDERGMYLNGIILISPVLDFQTIAFATGNDTPYWLYVPTYAATAWYHGKLSPAGKRDLLATLEEAERFAGNEYLLVLSRGAAMDATARAEATRKLAALTGVSEDFARRANLRIDIGDFVKELCRADAKTVGRLDSRYTGIDRDGVGSSYEYDPSYAAILGPYTGAINDYLQRELNYQSDSPYEILTSRVHPWSFAGSQNQFVNVAERLRGAMTRNRNLRVFVASGLYDLATPYFSARYTLDHMGLDETLRANASLHTYKAGHMMYVRDEDRAALKADVAKFVEESLSTPRAKSETLPPPAGK